MNFREQLTATEAAHSSMLCVGLDPEPARFPLPWRGDASRIFDFCAAIVDATRDLVIAFKPQIAYFAAQRAEDQLERLVRHIHASAPGVPVILDAKRGDIGATAEQYAREAFERYEADALTLSPFMGLDSVQPYMRYAGKGLILLCRTSNPGGSELQAQTLAGAGDASGRPGDKLYEHIARLAAGPWNSGGQLGLVVGATYPQELARVRELAPGLPLLIPGIGAQGGDAQATVRAAWRPGAPIIVSSSRAVLYAHADAPSMDVAAAAARAVAQATRQQLHAARPGAAALAPPAAPPPVSRTPPPKAG
jgi:orotidine-5'-phosphate decarboxylase